MGKTKTRDVTVASAAEAQQKQHFSLTTSCLDSRTKRERNIRKRRNLMHNREARKQYNIALRASGGLKQVPLPTLAGCKS